MTTFRPHRPVLVRHLLLLVLATAPLACKDGGCSGSSNTAPTASGTASASAGPSSSAASSASATSLRARWNLARASGAAGAIFRAVNTIELEDEQKAALEKIGTELREAERAARDTADGGGGRNEMREAHAALIAGVKAGKIESAKMQPHYEALEKAAKARQDREADALNRVHATLKPAQRAAVVASVRSTEEKRASRMKFRERADAGSLNFAKFRLERYTRDLALDAEQQKKVDAILPKEDRAASGREEAKKHMDALLTAFEKDGFDAKQIDSGQVKLARAPIEEQVKLFGQLLPILKPEQRERLAKTLERTSDHARPHRGLSTSERVHDHDDSGDDDHDVH